MTCINGIKSKRALSIKLVAGLAFSAFLVLGTSIGSANAQPRQDQRRDEHRDEHRDRGWDRGHGYYAGPPVVYGAPYYAPPPVVYGPAIGVTLPGISIGIQ